MYHSGDEAEEDAAMAAAEAQHEAMMEAMMEEAEHECERQNRVREVLDAIHRQVEFGEYQAAERTLYRFKESP